MPADNLRTVNQVTMEELRRIAGGDAAYCYFDHKTAHGNAVRRKQLVDGVTAKAVVLVYDAVNDDNKAKIARMVAGTLGQFYKISQICLGEVSFK